MSADHGVTSHELLIGGHWVEAAEGDAYEETSPASGRPLASLAAAGPEDVDRAVRAARAAAEAWAREPVFARADRCHAVAEVIAARADELAAELCVEHGKPLADAKAEVMSAAEGFRLAAEEVKRLGGDTIPVRDATKRVLTMRVPRGVWAVLTPFNFPINIPVEYLGPAVATGNAVVWKAAPTTSRVAVRLAECIVDAGVPDGVVNLLTGPSLEMSRRLVSHPGVDGVGFTGSSAAGEAIAREAAGKQLLMELGGNGPVIVLEDADMDRAAAAIASAAFWNAGQSCAAAGRVLVEPAVERDLAAGLAEQARGEVLGLPWQEGTTLGPVHTPAVAETTLAHVADAREHGADLLHGGAAAEGLPTRLYLEPTVMAGVPLAAIVQQQETFGPLAALSPVSGDDAILAAADASDLGLSCAIFTRDVARALRLAERLRVGQVVVNDTSNYWELHMPFGGGPGKRSGMGRVGGRYALEAMTDLRSVAIDVR